MFELIWPEKQELLELMWQKYPAGVFSENTISYDKVEGIQSVQKEASDKKYVPPNIRMFGDDTSSSSVAPPAQGPIPGLPPGYTSSKSQAAAKGRSNNNRQKPTTISNAANTKTPDSNDDERKKATAIKKKLKDIKVLKDKAEKGEKLDKNQLNKIASESELTKELAALQLS